MSGKGVEGRVRLAGARVPETRASGCLRVLVHRAPFGVGGGLDVAATKPDRPAEVTAGCGATRGADGREGLSAGSDRPPGSALAMPARRTRQRRRHAGQARKDEAIASLRAAPASSPVHPWGRSKVLPHPTPIVLGDQGPRSSFSSCRRAIPASCGYYRTSFLPSRSSDDWQDRTRSARGWPPDGRLGRRGPGARRAPSPAELPADSDHRVLRYGADASRTVSPARLGPPGSWRRPPPRWTRR